MNKLEIDLIPNGKYVKLNDVKVEIYKLQRYKDTDVWRMEFRAESTKTDLKEVKCNN